MAEGNLLDMGDMGSTAVEGGSGGGGGGGGGGSGGFQDDLSGGGSSDGSDGGDDRGGAEPVQIDPSLIPSMREWFRKACVTGKTLLYRDGHVEVGMAQQYKDAQGRIMLFLGNKFGGELNNFAVNIPEIPQIVFKGFDAPSSLPAGAQEKIQLQFMCKQPFVQPPEIRISFTAGGVPHERRLRLPVVVSSFMSAAAMEPARFTQTWDQLAAKEAQKVFDAGGAAVTGEGLDLTVIRALLEESCKLAIIPGLGTWFGLHNWLRGRGDRRECLWLGCCRIKGVGEQRWWEVEWRG